MRAATAVMVLVGATAARADTPRATPAAIEVDRDDSPGGRSSLGFDAGEPVDSWGVSLAASWLDQPLRLGAGGLGPGTPASQPVRRRETLAVGGAIAIGDSFVVDGVLRGSHQLGDRLAAAGDPARLASYVFGDLRLGGRIRVAGDRDAAFLVRGELTLPTGNEQQFAGEARSTFAWSLIGRARLPHDIAVAASGGIRLRRAEIAIGDRLVGDELFGAASIAVPLPGVGTIGPLAGPMQLCGALLGALGDRVGGLAGPSPLEARFGIQVAPLADLSIGAQVGFGLADQIGAPRLRALIQLAYTPRAAAAPAAPVKLPAADESDDPDDEP